MKSGGHFEKQVVVIIHQKYFSLLLAGNNMLPVTEELFFTTGCRKLYYIDVNTVNYM